MNILIKIIIKYYLLDNSDILYLSFNNHLVCSPRWGAIGEQTFARKIIHRRWERESQSIMSFTGLGHILQLCTESDTQHHSSVQLYAIRTGGFWVLLSERSDAIQFATSLQTFEVTTIVQLFRWVWDICTAVELGCLHGNSHSARQLRFFTRQF